MEQASQPGADGSRLIDDPSVRTRLAQAAVEAEMSDLLGMRAGWMHHVGQRPLVEGSMAKVYSSEAFSRATSDMLDIFGPTALQRGRGLGDDTLGTIEHDVSPQPGDPDLCRYQRDPPEYHCRGWVGPPRTRAAG